MKNFNQELTTTELSNINGGFNLNHNYILPILPNNNAWKFIEGFKKGWNKVK